MSQPVDTALAGAVAEAVGDLLLELDRQQVCLRAQGPASLLGIEDAGLAGMTLKQLLPVASELAGASAAAVLDDGIPRSFDYSVEGALGSHHLEVKLGRSPSGTLLACVRDVRARILAAAALKQSEERFRVMADCAPVMLWKSDRSAECDFFNRGWLEFTGRSLAEESGIGWTAGVHPEDFEPCMNIYMSAYVARESFRMEYRLRRADGAYRWILDHGVPRFAVDGAFEGYIGSCVDVTEIREANRRNAELNAALRQRLREREVLLREIHHRVKNNLQLISSILSLQARLLSGQARSVLEEGQLRVRSIALVHEKLCSSETLSDIELGQYLGDLIAFLRCSVEGASKVDVQLEAVPLTVAIDQAVPCGLVINELVTNALKHAFPPPRRGSVTVQVRPLDGGRLRLCVSDDGVGLPDHVDVARPSTLGLDLVATLARQLHGELRVDRTSGTKFALELERWRTDHASQ